MKKLLSLVLAMMIFALPCLAESTDIGVIGGADSLTGLQVSEDFITSDSLLEEAISAGRRVTMNITVPEVSGIDTGDAAVDTAIADALNALGLRMVLQGDEYDMGVTLSGQDALTLGWAVNGEDVYLKSNLIGGTIVLSEPEIEPIVSRLLDMFVMMEAMTEEEAADIKAQVPVMIEQVKTAIAQNMGTSMTMEELLALDYSAFTKVTMKLMIDLEEIEEIVVPGMCDMATHGVRLSIDNKEFVDFIRALFQFIQDNPKMMDMVAAQGNYPTEESRSLDWQTNGELYKQFKFYDSEEEYIAENPTFAEAMEQAVAELDTLKLLDGEFVTAVYLNDDEEVVYLTSVLPMFTEEESLFETEENAEVKGTTEKLNVVYTRQTVAQGVSHVCNIDVDGEGVTIDVLAQENAWNIRMGDMASQETMITVNAMLEGNAVKGTFTTNEEKEEVFAGDFLVGHVADEAQFKTDITLNIKYTTTLANEENHDISIDYTCDYARSGVDFSGAEKLTVVVDAVKVVIQGDIATSEPADSIMSGNVTRPAELNDADFANWFVSAYNSVNSWMGNVMMALPESVLMLMFSTSNTGY